MKIEMDGNSMAAVCTVAVCVTLVALSWLVYRYNIKVYELGYTQQQLQNSQITMWVKSQ